MRVVLDTNVFIAAVVADGLCRDLVRVRLLPHTLIISEPLLHELRTVLRAKFAVDPVELPLLAQLNEEAEIVTPAELRGGVCCDEDDDVVLATALAGKADVIVTGDEDLLVRKNFAGLKFFRHGSFWNYWIELADRG